MINAGPDSRSGVSVFVKYDSTYNAVTVISNRNITAGEELRISYVHDMTNTDYLLHYGFMFEDIPDLTMGFKVEFLKDDAEIETKKKILLKMKGIDRIENDLLVRVFNTTNENSTLPLISAYRVINLKDKDKLQQLLLYSGTKNDSVPKISDENEKAAISSLNEKLRKRLSEYPTTINVDFWS